jgi:hypothetical protein
VSLDLERFAAKEPAMRPLTFAVLLLAGAAAPLPAAAKEKDQPRPNTLTKQEMAGGWLLLFDGTTTFGWQVDGELAVKDGALVLGGKKKTAVLLDLGYFEASWEYRWEGGTSPRREARATLGGKGVGSSGGALSVAGPKSWVLERWELQPGPPGAAGSTSEFKVDSAKGASGHTNFQLQADSHVLVELTIPEGTTLSLRNFKIKPLGLKAVFNGKDLKGWQEIPGKKSKFSVNDQGALNIKDGPGDIQTQGQWDDFVLQLDVFSNGPHLNSGVFFRCLPGQFWNGYEAQIRNEWVTEVVLKDGTRLKGSYTPQGDEIVLRICQVEGKQVKMTKEVRKLAKTDIAHVIDHRDLPIDYGTGAIYNRQPARKVVSSDHEWFTMTVLAREKRLRVWVNGYQTADFTDPRPANESARKGSKTDAGPVSLQGHDPTTDLSFRNIRVVPLVRAGASRLRLTP